MTWRTKLREESIMTEGGCDNCEMTWEELGLESPKYWWCSRGRSPSREVLPARSGWDHKPCARGEVGSQTWNKSHEKIYQKQAKNVYPNFWPKVLTVVKVTTLGFGPNMWLFVKVTILGQLLFCVKFCGNWPFWLFPNIFRRLKKKAFLDTPLSSDKLHQILISLVLLEP